MEKLSDSKKTLMNNMSGTEIRSKISFNGTSNWQELGQERSEVIHTLQYRLRGDMTYESGRILGAMTQPGHPFAQNLYQQFNTRNLGDPGLVPATRDIEQEVISMLGNLLGDSEVSGNITSGGTEANLIALLLARQSTNHIIHPEIVVPDSAHYSFDKAAALMGLQVKRARLDSKFALDMDHYESLITDNTIALIGVAGTTALGLIDPLPEIGKLARKYHLFYHVDGAFGGLIFPFLEELGHKLPAYSLKVPEIVTYTVDPHKFGQAVNPTGGILVRGLALEDHKFAIPYLAGGGFKSFNILGTRPGAPVVSFWGLMHHLGKDGFRQSVKRCWDLTQYLIDELKHIPEIDIAIDPIAPVVGLQTTTASSYRIDQIDQKLRKRGWALGLFAKENLLRVVIMPHIYRNHIDAFLADLKAVLN